MARSVPDPLRHFWKVRSGERRRDSSSDPEESVIEGPKEEGVPDEREVKFVEGWGSLVVS